MTASQALPLSTSESLWTVGRLVHALETELNALFQSFNLSFNRAQVLVLLLDAPHLLSQARLTDALGVEHASGVKILNGMEDRGLIFRVVDRNDRRARLIGLTDDGLLLAQDVAQHAERLCARLFNIPYRHNMQASYQLIRQLSATLGAGDRRVEIHPAE